MDKKKFTLVWYKRFDDVNEWIIKILGSLTILGLTVPVGYVIFVTIAWQIRGNSVKWGNVVLFILSMAVAYWLFWNLFRLSLFVYDYFKNS